MQTSQADIHANHEDMQKELEMVLRSQVLMSDSLDKLTGRMTELAEAHRLTEESLRHTDRRMDALILTVDEIVRGRNGGPTVPEV